MISFYPLRAALIGNIVSFLDQHPQEQFQGFRYARNKDVWLWNCKKACKYGYIHMTIGVACATLPTSSSFCIIFLILACLYMQVLSKVKKVKEGWIPQEISYVCACFSFWSWFSALKRDCIRKRDLSVMSRHWSCDHHAQLIGCTIHKTAQLHPVYLIRKSLSDPNLVYHNCSRHVIWATFMLISHINNQIQELSSIIFDQFSTNNILGRKVFNPS